MGMISVSLLFLLLLQRATANVEGGLTTMHAERSNINNALYLAILLVAADAVRTGRFLVTATNHTNGVEVRIFPDSNVNSDNGWSSYEQRIIEGRFLSAECGKKFRECAQPVVISANERKQSFVVILPFVKALGLIPLKVNKTGLLTTNDEHIIDLSENYDCSPASVYEIRNSYYVVCANADSGYIKLLKLRIDTTHLERSYVPVLEHPQLHSVHNMTNSLYVDLPAQSGPVIFFATGYSAFYFKPLLNLMEDLDIQLQENECFATSIDYIGEWEMLIYCDNDRAVYVDLNREFIFESVEYAKDGRPYVCPNPDIYLAVNVYTTAEYILYAFRSNNQVKILEMGRSSFDSGVCLESQNVTLFAFTDRERGIQVLNVSTGSITSLSDTTCTNHPCQPLVVLQDRYLVIRENRAASWYTSVLDSHNNFSIVLEAQHSNADLMAVIEVDIFESESAIPSQVNESIPSLEENTKIASLLEADEQNRDDNTRKTVAAIVTPTAFIAVVTGVLAFIAFVILKTKQCAKQRVRLVSNTQEQKCGLDGTEMIPPKLPIDENRAKIEVETSS